MNRMLKHAALILLGLGCLVSASSMQAAVLVYTIDPSQSSLTLAVQSSDGVQISSPQFAGSDTTYLTGTITADVVPGISVQILDGHADFGLQALPVTPDVATGTIDNPGSGPGFYGLNLVDNDGIQSVMAIDQGFLAFTSGPLTTTLPGPVSPVNDPGYTTVFVTPHVKYNVWRAAIFPRTLVSVRPTHIRLRRVSEAGGWRGHGGGACSVWLLCGGILRAGR